MNIFSISSGNSLSQGEKYLNHFAGESSNQASPIDFSTRWTASCAQKHPKTNTLFAAIDAGILTGGLTTLALLTTPFFTPASEGFSWNATPLSICSSTPSNSDRVLKFLSQLGDLTKGYAPSNVKSFITGKLGSIAVPLNCLFNKVNNEDENFTQFRLINYLGSILSLIEEYALPIAVTSLALGFSATLIQKSNYEAKEIKIEKDLIKEFTEIFKNSAKLLKAKKIRAAESPEKEQAIKNLAESILRNKAAINKEINDLKLPSLTPIKIRALTQPLFEAAEEVSR